VAAAAPRLFRALYDYAASAPTDLSFRAGDTIAVLDTAGGNHEAWFEHYARGQGLDPEALGAFVGGLATLRSYGLDVRDPRALAEGWRAIPAAHREFVASLPVALRLVVDGGGRHALRVGRRY
jgi:hypothetical protein